MIWIEDRVVEYIDEIKGKYVNLRVLIIDRFYCLMEVRSKVIRKRWR